MKIEPSNFYISIVDLFAVLLPGTLGVIYIRHNFVAADQIPGFLTDKDFIYGFVFLLASYLCGHLIHLIGSFVDDIFYDPFKGLFFPNKTRLDKVRSIREKIYGHNAAKSDIKSTFEWSRFKIQKEEAGVYSEIEKSIADSKFFRGFFVVLLIIIVNSVLEVRTSDLSLASWVVLSIGCIVFLFIKTMRSYGEDKIEKDQVKGNNKKSKRTISALLFLSIIILFAASIISNFSALNNNIWIMIILTVFSFSRYVAKRRKSTETAYKYIIFIEELNTKKA